MLRPAARLPLFSHVPEDEVRQLDDEPAKAGILLKKREHVVGMVVVPNRQSISANRILFDIFVAPTSRILAAIMLVTCQMCCSHGYSPKQGTPPIVFQDDTMNQVGGEFKTKIGNVWKMPIAAVKRGGKEICQPVLAMLRNCNVPSEKIRTFGLSSDSDSCCAVDLRVWRARLRSSPSGPFG